MLNWHIYRAIYKYSINLDELVDDVVDNVVHLGVRAGWDALLAGELVDSCKQ
jgi:hypothetical protein